MLQYDFLLFRASVGSQRGDGQQSNGAASFRLRARRECISCECKTPFWICYKWPKSNVNRKRIPQCHPEKNKNKNQSLAPANRHLHPRTVIKTVHSTNQVRTQDTNTWAVFFMLVIKDTQSHAHSNHAEKYVHNLVAVSCCELTFLGSYTPNGISEQGWSFRRNPKGQFP